VTLKNDTKVPVFFYGTFMRTAVLRDYGVDVIETIPARLLDFELTIKPRVNLKRRTNGLVFGGIAIISHLDIERLYDGLREEFGIQYYPHPVTAIVQTGRLHSVLCYMSEDISNAEPDPSYLDDLAQCALETGAPQDYIDHIYSFGSV